MPAALSYINHQLRAISAWGNRWQVTFAPEKTQMMIVSRHHDGNAGAVVRMNGTMLAPGEEADILGVKFDSKLTMKNHVVNLANKAARKLTALRRISHLLDSRGCKILYEAQVRSHLEYAPLSWFACPPSHLRLLDRVENRARRLISRLDPSWMDLSFQQSLQHRRDVGGLTVMYKANIVKIPHLDPLRGQRETSFYATRRAESSNFTLAVPFSRTSLHLRSYIPRMTRVWNTFVQHNVNEITSVDQMKMLAHRWLQLHPVPYLYVS
nr:uncharacterized protein LOC128694747 [Cherax quadricarinatus]